MTKAKKAKKATKKMLEKARIKSFKAVVLMICNPSCVTTIPDNGWSNGCDTTYRNGGIPRMLFLKCDPAMVLPYTGGWANVDNVKWAMCNDFLYVSAPLLGNKPKGSFTKKRLDSCSPEVTIAGTKTIAFQDYNANAELEDYAFWDAINKTKKFLQLGWITCDDRLYMYAGNWDLEIDEQIDATYQDQSFWDGLVTMATKDIIIPISCPGIKAMIDAFNTADCGPYT